MPWLCAVVCFDVHLLTVLNVSFMVMPMMTLQTNSSIEKSMALTVWQCLMEDKINFVEPFSPVV